MPDPSYKPADGAVKLHDELGLTSLAGGQVVHWPDRPGLSQFL
jgi:hypothetical protein